MYSILFASVASPQSANIITVAGADIITARNEFLARKNVNCIAYADAMSGERTRQQFDRAKRGQQTRIVESGKVVLTVR